MRSYIIDGTTVTAYAERPGNIAEYALAIATVEELAASALAATQMAEIWRGLPNATPLKSFRSREAAVSRLWAAFEALPVTEPGGGPKTRTGRADSKQARVIAMLRRPEGASIDEIAETMSWQRHTVRGLIAGALKKKHGLDIVNEKRADGARIYRIAEAG
jgi:hypothetical protein